MRLLVLVAVKYLKDLVGATGKNIPIKILGCLRSEGRKGDYHRLINKRAIILRADIRVNYFRKAG